MAIETKNTERQGQRRWAAILFADVVGSTELAETLGDEPFYDLMRDVMAEVWAIVETNHGHTVEYAGDSILAVFGAPVAVENASLNACRAALAIQAYVDGAAADLEAKYGGAPRLRIGIAGGIVTVGDLAINAKMGLNVLGSAVNMASRVENLAPPGEVLITSRIVDQVDSLVDAPPIGAKALKGFTEPEPLFRLERLREADNVLAMRLRRGAQKFVGRTDELTQLWAWARCDPGTPAMLDVLGPAGIGKSRLLYELGKTLKRDVTLVSGGCDVGRRNTSYFPLVALIRDYLGWSVQAPLTDLRARIAAKFDEPLAQADAFVGRIAGKASLSDEDDREQALQIRAGLSQALMAMSQDTSTALIVEDVHWIDPTSHELLKELSQRDGFRIAVTRRPGGGESSVPAATLVTLRPLATHYLGGVIASVLGVEDVPDDLLTFVEKASGGMPLFAEEVVQFLRADGQVTLVDGVAIFRAKDGALAEAGNLQNLILSTFDGLSDPAKKCLEIAATRGRRFGAGFLETCVGDKEMVFSAIDEVTSIGIVEVDPRGGRRALQFSHALVGDSIYGSLLASRRKTLHQIVADALESDPNATAEERAFHFEQAGDFTQAVRNYWRSASDAMGVYAVDIADQQLERAFLLIEKAPESIADSEYGEVLVLHCRALDVFGNFRRVNEVIGARLTRLAALGPSRNHVICLTLQALSRCHGAQYEQAKDIIAEAARVSAQIDDAAAAAWVQVAKMRIYSDTEFVSSDEIEGIFHALRPVTDQLDDRHVLQALIYNMQASYRRVGEMKKAEALVEELEAFGQKTNDSRAIAYANWAKAVHCFTKRDAVAVRAATDKVLKHAVPGTADWRVASVYQLAAGLLDPGTGPDPDLFTQHMDMTLGFEDYTLRHTTWVGRMLACFKAGQIARGKREMAAMKAEFNAKATTELQRVMLIYQSEILLAISGVKPSTGPRPKLGFADLVAFVRLRIFARRRAEKMLRRYLDWTPVRIGALVAQAHYGLGLIAHSRGQLDDARDHLVHAAGLYADQGYEAAEAEVRQILTDAD